jgi:hypothetical protein
MPRSNIGALSSPIPGSQIPESPIQQTLIPKPVVPQSLIPESMIAESSFPGSPTQGSQKRESPIPEISPQASAAQAFIGDHHTDQPEATSAGNPPVSLLTGAVDQPPTVESPKLNTTVLSSESSAEQPVPAESDDIQPLDTEGVTEEPTEAQEPFDRLMGLIQLPAEWDDVKRNLFRTEFMQYWPEPRAIDFDDMVAAMDHRTQGKGTIRTGIKACFTYVGSKRQKSGIKTNGQHHVRSNCPKHGGSATGLCLYSLYAPGHGKDVALPTDGSIRWIVQERES